MRNPTDSLSCEWIERIYKERYASYYKEPIDGIWATDEHQIVADFSNAVPWDSVTGDHWLSLLIRLVRWGVPELTALA
jgi:hypothetical protein